MGTRAVASGPIGDRVRRRVASLRENRRLTLAELSARMTALGRPILPTGLSKIENGDRRVDVDDLVALAVALNVAPNDLLLPDERSTDAEVALTPATVTTARNAWMWAIGKRPLGPDSPDDSPIDEDVPAWRQLTAMEIVSNELERRIAALERQRRDEGERP